MPMLLIGETLNSSSPSVHAALAGGDRGWLVRCARRQVEAGMDLLDCNAATFPGQEAPMLEWLVGLVEATVDLPVAVDSGEISVLHRVGVGRRHPPLLNSVEARPPWPEPVLDLVRHSGASLVIQLRRRSQIPQDLDQRLHWAEVAVEAAQKAGLPLERIFLDPVLLPWGEDLVEGTDVLRFVEEAPRRWRGVKTLVGLSNVSYGRSHRSRADRQWLAALQDAGLTAAILNPFDPDLVRLARR